MIRAAIFDFDGTLFDSMFIWDTIGEDYLRSIAYEPRENLNRVFKTMSLYQAACHYKSEYGVTLSVDEIMNGVNKVIEHYYVEDVKPKEGVESFLQKLKAYGVQMCIATATDQYMIQAALARCNLSSYFSDIFTCSAVGHGKDKPDIFREALQHLGTKKENTLVFEDALYAIRTAKTDGFPVAAIFDKYEENQEDIKKLSDIYLSEYSDFEAFWKSASAI